MSTHHATGTGARFRANSSDPTSTKTVRDQYARQLRKRYRVIARGVREWVGEADAFGLTDRDPDPGGGVGGYSEGFAVHPLGPPDDPERFDTFDECVAAVKGDDTTEEEARRICGKWEQRVSGNALAGHAPGDKPDLLPAPTIPAPRQPTYDFPSDEARVAAFRRWLSNATDAVVLGGPGDTRWTDEYIRYAYGRGVVHANHRLSNAGYQPDDVELRDAFRRPLHERTLGVFYRRQYELLDGVNEAMGKEMSRVLTEGMLAGENPRDIARTMTGAVQSVGIKRANTIARTETIHAYNEAALNRYERILGSTGKVSAVVELATAGDSRVCEQCQSLDGVVYTISEAHNVIPVHPNCRCAWLPLSRTQAETM